MDDPNPYAPPSVPLDRRKRPAKRETGPILYSLLAVVLGWLLLGFLGLIVSGSVVGWFWISRLWPRPPAPEAEGAREFLQNLEAPTVARPPAPEAIIPAVDDQTAEVFREIRL